MANRYELGEEIGRGSFGVTHIARDTHNNTVVAVKLIDVAASEAKGIRKSLIMGELELLKMLSSSPNCNPHIVCYDTYFETNVEGHDAIAVVSEYIEGGPLSDFIQRQISSGREIDPSVLWKMMKQSLSAIEYIHSRDVAHRDLKPANIMLTSNGDIKIIDFGVSCTSIAPPYNNVEFLPCIAGFTTPKYAPPEMFVKPRPTGLTVAKAHDIWSLGVIFYLMANLRFPYINQHIKDLDDVKRSYQQPLHRSRYTGAPSNFPIPNEIFNFLIESMLEKNWNNRPTARQLVQYMAEEEIGCTIGDQKLHRIQILDIFAQNNVNIENKYVNMADLCRLLGSYTGINPPRFPVIPMQRVAPTRSMILPQRTTQDPRQFTQVIPTGQLRGGTAQIAPTIGGQQWTVGGAAQPQYGFGQGRGTQALTQSTQQTVPGQYGFGQGGGTQALTQSTQQTVPGQAGTQMLTQTLSQRTQQIVPGQYTFGQGRMGYNPPTQASQPNFRF